MEKKIKIFENKNVRTVWNEEEEDWYFSVVDICWILADSADFTTARKYWNKLKQRLKAEGSELVTNCHQLKLPAADGKNYSKHACRSIYNGNFKIKGAGNFL